MGAKHIRKLDPSKFVVCNYCGSKKFHHMDATPTTRTIDTSTDPPTLSRPTHELENAVRVECVDCGAKLMQGKTDKVNELVKAEIARKSGV